MIALAPSSAPVIPTYGALTSEQRILIKSSAPALAQHGGTITRLFYKNMLEANPDFCNLFAKSAQDSGRQADALATAVHAYADNIEDLTPLLPAVEHIAQRHAAVQIKPEDYIAVGTHLIAAVATVLGAAVTPALAEAWTIAYWNLAYIFIARERALYSSAPWKGWKRLVVVEKKQETEEIVSLVLKDKDGGALPGFKAGQYLSLRLWIPELECFQIRQYSLSQAPNPGSYRVTVRLDRGNLFGTPGEVSQYIHKYINVGDTIECTAPYGTFKLDEEAAPDAPVVLISAGVGATPMMSMLESLIDSATSQLTRPVSWIQTARDLASLPFASRIQTLSTSLSSPDLHTTIFLSQPTNVSQDGTYTSGRLHLSLVPEEKLFLANEATTYYICGREEFMMSARDYLVGEKSVAKERVHVEFFGAAK